MASFFQAPVSETSGAWAVTAVTGLDRTVRVAAGKFWADGILNLAATTTDVQLPTVASGSRWFTILLNQDWTYGGSGQSSVTFAGPSTDAVVNLGADTTPGFKCNYPLALVRVQSGVQVPTQVIDKRTTLGEIRRGWKDEWITVTKPGSILDDASHGHTWAYRYSAPAGRIEIRGAVKALDGQFSATSTAAIGSPLPADARPNRPQYHIGAAALDSATDTWQSRYYIDTNGQIYYWNPTGPLWMSFDGWVYDLN
jgi:hypothetical protein